MAYKDFTLDSIDTTLDVVLQPADLFQALAPVPVPSWLRDLLAKTMQLALVSEKARSEFIVVPILVAVRELSNDAIAIYSGQRLDVQPERGLVGECDFILARTPPVPMLRAPIVTIVEAKKNDIEAGLGQCVAQMVGARVFNERAGKPRPVLYGCVTTGEDWQFLALRAEVVTLDRKRYYIDNPGGILAVFQAIVTESGGEA